MLSDWFETLVGVLQGCVLSPLLFSVMLEIVVAMSLEERDIGVTISGFLCSNLRFADDIALLAESDRDLQSQVNNLHAVSTWFGLKIRPSKTEVQCCSRDPPAIQINIDGSRLGHVEQFTYLGGVIHVTTALRMMSGKELAWPRVLRPLSRSFAVAGPKCWNKLPVGLRDLSVGPETIARRLKTHFFRVGFSD